jgi:hypothetical protein
MKHIVPPAEVTKQFDPQTPQNLTFFIMPGNDKTEGIYILSNLSKHNNL